MQNRETSKRARPSSSTAFTLDRGPGVRHHDEIRLILIFFSTQVQTVYEINVYFYRDVKRFVLLTKPYRGVSTGMKCEFPDSEIVDDPPAADKNSQNRSSRLPRLDRRRGTFTPRFFFIKVPGMRRDVKTGPRTSNADFRTVG